MYLVANQLELSGGMRRDRGECLVDAELYMPPAAIQKRGNLYLIAEVEGAPVDQIDPGGQRRSSDLALCHETEMTILQEYYNFNSNATITSALRHALEVANQQVFNRNSATLPPERRGIGVTCAVLRGTEIYLAQMSPTQAFLTHQGQLKCLPSAPAQMSSLPPVIPISAANQNTLPLPAKTNPRPALPLASLGRYANIEPSLSRHVFEEGDLLVLCSTNLSENLSNEQAEEFFLGQDGRAALYQLADFARSQHVMDGYILTIGSKANLVVGSAPNIGASRNGSTPKAEENPGRLRGSVEGVAASVSLLTSKFASRHREHPATPAHEEYVYEDSLPRVRPKSVAQQVENPAQVVPLVITTDNSKAAADGGGIEPLALDDRNQDPWLRREDDDVQQPPYLRNRKMPNEPPVPPVPPSQPSQAEPRNFTYNDGAGHGDPGSNRPYMPMPSFGGDYGEEPTPPEDWQEPPEPRRGRNRKQRAAARLEANPSNSPYVDLVGVDGYGPPLEGRTQRPRRFAFDLRGKRWPLIVALAGLLVVAVLFLLFAINGGPTSNNSKALDLVKAAEQKRGQAQALAATNPAQARKLIEQAQADLAAASKEKADLKDIGSVQNGLRITLDNINKVVVPADLRLAVDLTSQGTGVRLSQGVLSPTGDTLYLLDSGKGVVYAADLTGNIKPILKTGDPAGGSVFGKPLALTARLDSIVVVDDQNISYVYNKDKGDWTAVKLGGTGTWTKGIRQIATYQGNLYLLGPVGGQILKYNAGAYQGNPEEWLNPAAVDNLKLDQASAFAIDGNIYTLSKEGRLLQLGRPAGKPKGEAQTDTDLNSGDKVGPVLNNPLSLKVGELEYPYIFVVDNEKRILQFQKEGGNFIQQFQAAPTGKEFDTLRDVAIDATNNKLYAIGEQKVYVFRLPANTAGPVINATVSGPATTTTAPVPSPSASPKP
jgi:serine/threonine protein phosphatase PrpC